MKQNISSFAEDIIEQINQLEQLKKQSDFKELMGNWVTKNAIERSIEIISEATRHLPISEKEQHPHIKWREIAGTGNIFRHEYYKISIEYIYDILNYELEPLLEAMNEIYASLKTSENL